MTSKQINIDAERMASCVADLFLATARVERARVQLDEAEGTQSILLDDLRDIWAAIAARGEDHMNTVLDIVDIPEDVKKDLSK